MLKNAGTEAAAEKWIMLGAGAIARECFLPAFRHLGLLRNLTVADLSIPAELRAGYPSVTFVAADFRTVLESSPAGERVAAVVTLPNEFHQEAVLALLRRGADVLCEKPLALTEAACLEIGEIAERSCRVLAVDMIRRFYPSIRLAQQLVKDGRIGELKDVTIEHGGVFSWPAQTLAPFLPANGGVFADMGVHYLDMAERFAGAPLCLRDYLDDWQGGVEAEASADLCSSSGVAVHVSLSRLRRLQNTIRLRGSKGELTIPVDSFIALKFLPDGASGGMEIRPEEPFSDASLPASFAACFVEMLSDFRRRTAAKVPVVEDAAAAARAARLIQQAYQRHTAPNSRVTTSAAAILTPAPTLITGATGFIGAGLIKRLFGDGFSDVVSVVRRPQTCASIARFSTRLALADLLNADSVRRQMEGRRYVFHLAYGRDGAGTDSITVKGTQNVVQAAIDAGCEAVVILSTINVIGWPKGAADETSPYRPAGGHYGRSKAIMERWCLRQAAKTPRTRIVLLLPSCVYGAGGKTFTELPATLASLGQFAWIENGEGTANYVFLENLIDAILLAASTESAHGKRFVINDGCVTWREFLGPIVEPWSDQIRNYRTGELKTIGRHARKGSFRRAVRAVLASPDFRREIKQTPVGSMAAWLAAKANGTAGPSGPPLLAVPQGSQSPAPPAWLEDLFGPYETRFSAAKAQQELGWRPRIRLTDGQAISIAYLTDQGRYPKNDSRELACVLKSR